MAAPKGNRFWEARSSHGRKPIFATPEALWHACVEYFEWVDDNPLEAPEAVKFEGRATLTYVPKMRAMTMKALWLFLDISRDCWTSYRKKDDFIAICTRVETVIETQKFAGAAANLLNHAIIARDLGLRDVKTTEHTGTVNVAGLTMEQLDDQIRRLLETQNDARSGDE